MKKIIAILLMMTFLLTLLPTNIITFAAEVKDGLTITANGAEYVDNASVSLLSDGVYAVPGESTFAYNLFAKFADADDNILLEWGSTKDIKQLQLWVYPAGAINEYEIQFWNDEESDWDDDTLVGSFEQNVTGGEYAHFYPVVFDSVKETSKIKFIIKSFKTGVDAAYISQIEAHDSNEMNFIGLYQIPALGTGGIKERYYTKYARGFFVSKPSEGSASSYFEHTTRIWPGYDTGSVLNVKPSDTTLNTAWYGTTFNGNKVKVNRVKAVIHAGTATGIEILSNNGYIGNTYKNNACPDMQSGTDWVLEKKISGNFEAGTVTIDIPDANAATSWLIKFTGCDSSFILRNPSSGTGMFSLTENELSGFSRAVNKIFENIRVNEDKDYINLPQSLEYNSTNYPITWESNTDLIVLNNESGNLGSITYHEEDEKVTLTAKVSDDDGYTHYVTKEIILPARENICSVNALSGVSFESGINETILTDGFFFSEFDSREEGGILPTEKSDAFAKITQENAELKYSWAAPDVKNRLNLWVYPEGAIDEYEIYSSENGTSWQMIAEGNVEENIEKKAASSDYASYYPILFDEVTTKYLKLVIKSFGENVNEAYISEAAFSKDNNINLNAAPNGAAGEKRAYSHYTKGYILSNTSDANTMYVKSSDTVWPLYEDGTSPSVTPNGSLLWYATGFGGTTVKINRVVIPVLSGSGKEVELLCSDGEDSGFDPSSSSLPVSPDTLASYKSVATIKGTFNKNNPAVIDVINAPSSKYWMIKVKNASTDLSIGRPELYIVDEKEISALPKIAGEIFDFVTTDTDDKTTAKSSMTLPKTQEYGGKAYTIKWESTSNLLNCDTGIISEHETESKTVLTAYITDPDNTELSYCVKKEYKLIGMMQVFLFDKEGNKESTDILTDDFTYCSFNQRQLQAPNNAAYNLGKFVHLKEEGAGFEFSWEKTKKLKRLEMWSWPIDSILKYEIQISSDGEIWTTHYTGTNKDRYADAPQNRPADESDSAGKAYFSPIVFDAPTEEINYVRFIVKKLRDTEQGAYISEAYFYETNDINFASLGTIPGTEKGDKAESKYMQPFYTGDTAGNNGAYRKHEYRIWPFFSTGSADVLKAKEGDLLWYASSFQGNPVAINAASIKISAGEVREYEILCPVTSNTGIKWADYPTRPDTVAQWKTVARVSGVFGAGDTSLIHFDNKDASQWWMIKITQATDNLRISGVGFYKFGEYELNSSSFVLDNVFEGVEDTALDNVVKDKFTLPSTITRNGKAYDVIWNYDDTIINADGSVIPSTLDREMTLKAYVGSGEDNYKHVLEKKYFVLGEDQRAKTSLYNGENISVGALETKTLSASLESGFTFDGKKDIEIDLGEVPQKGKIKLLKEKEEVLTLSFKDGKIIVNEGTESEKSTEYTAKIKIALDKESYSLSKENSGIYSVAIYNEKLLTEKLPDTTILCADEATFNVKSLKITAAGEEVFDAIKEQFAFSKISPSFRATNLNGNLSLIPKVSDVVFTYKSGNNAIVNAQSGAVDFSAPAEDYIEVTGTSLSTGESFTKKYTLLIGRDNVFGNAKASSPNSGKDGKDGSNLADGIIETDFVTDTLNWRVSLDLKEIKSFNKLRIYEADTEAKIQKYTVTVSNNNVDFTEVFSSDNLVSGEDVTIPYTEARFVRINFVSTGGATGVKEICAYNEMSTQEKVDYDFNALIKNLKVENGSIIPKNGKFGTQFSLVSDNSAVVFTETDDKKNWKVVVLNSSFEVNVKITLRANLQGAQMRTKDYSLILFADTNLGDNVIEPNEPSGLGGGGGGGSYGGGGKVSSTSVAITPDNNAIENASRVNELTNHWGANEIKTLVSRGIVQGDGNSLNLTKSVTRAEFCKMIITGFGYELKAHNGTFYDVNENDWFAPFAQTAFEYGIMSGDANGFRGNDTISRQEMAVVLVNALKSFLPELKAEEGVEFSDNTNIASWANDAVKIASSLKLLTGYETGDFKPEKNLQRDEAMVVIYRVLSHIGK